MSQQYIHGTSPDEQSRLAKLNEMTNAAFLDFVRVPSGAKVLEVGSGLGILADAFAAAYPSSKIVGIEYSPEQLKVAEEKKRPNLRFLQGDAHELPFNEGEFDVVYCRYLLEHVNNPVQVMSEIKRVLKPSGAFFAQENNILAFETHPDCLNFELVWQNFALLQEALGGDALIGKKLFGLAKRAGFKQLELSVAPEIHAYGSRFFRPWVENIIGNIRGGAKNLKVHSLATDEEIEEAIKELAALQENPEAATYFYWNRITARP